MKPQPDCFVEGLRRLMSIWVRQLCAGSEQNKIDDGQNLKYDAHCANYALFGTPLRYRRCTTRTYTGCESSGSSHQTGSPVPLSANASMSGPEEGKRMTNRNHAPDL
jgi:hypothetical protein